MSSDVRAFFGGLTTFYSELDEDLKGLRAGLDGGAPGCGVASLGESSLKHINGDIDQISRSLKRVAANVNAGPDGRFSLVRAPPHPIMCYLVLSLTSPLPPPLPFPTGKHAV